MVIVLELNIKQKYKIKGRSIFILFCQVLMRAMSLSYNMLLLFQFHLILKYNQNLVSSCLTKVPFLVLANVENSFMINLMKIKMLDLLKLQLVLRHISKDIFISLVSYISSQMNYGSFNIYTKHNFKDAVNSRIFSTSYSMNYFQIQCCPSHKTAIWIHIGSTGYLQKSQCSFSPI